MGAVIGAGMGINAVSSFLGNSSFQSSFSMMNFIQILLILPLIGAFMPLKVIDFIRSMSFGMFNFDFIPQPFDVSTGNGAYIITFDQSNDYLNLIGLESGSSFVNLISSFGYFAFTPPIHILLLMVL